MILRSLVDQTRDLSWSRYLITLLLDELHVGDEFLDLIDADGRVDLRQYPQLVAIALILRHSWSPDDLVATARRLGFRLPRVTTRGGACGF
ncbi:MAG: hypothetical protein ACRD2X_14675 [Vicinamibacteraceae bacterium]